MRAHRFRFQLVRSRPAALPGRGGREEEGIRIFQIGAPLEGEVLQIGSSVTTLPAWPIVEYSSRLQVRARRLLGATRRTLRALSRPGRVGRVVHYSGGL